MSFLDADIAIHGDRLEYIIRQFITYVGLVIEHIVVCDHMGEIMAFFLEEVSSLGFATKQNCESKYQWKKFLQNSEEKGKEIKRRKRDVEALFSKFSLLSVGIPEIENKANEAKTII